MYLQEGVHTLYMCMGILETYMYMYNVLCICPWFVYWFKHEQYSIHVVDGRTCTPVHGE